MVQTMRLTLTMKRKIDKLSTWKIKNNKKQFIVLKTEEYGKIIFVERIKDLLIFGKRTALASVEHKGHTAVFYILSFLNDNINVFYAMSISGKENEITFAGHGQINNLEERVEAAQIEMKKFIESKIVK